MQQDMLRTRCHLDRNGVDDEGQRHFAEAEGPPELRVCRMVLSLDKWQPQQVPASLLTTGGKSVSEAGTDTPSLSYYGSLPPSVTPSVTS